MPRKRDSYWSAVNTRRASQLIELGRMTPAGLEAFERRDVERTRRHTHARATAELAPGERKAFMAHRGAWSFRRANHPPTGVSAAWYVVSAKREETRRR